jgi:hypothetical protein
LRAAVELRVGCSREEARRALQSVLAPDNKDAPRGLAISMKGRGRALTFTAESDSAATSLSTAMAVLGDIGLFQKVWLLSNTNRG